MTDKLEQGACCICGSTIGSMGHGHNPAPVKTEGRCCDYCNLSVVIPQRLQDFIDNPEIMEAKLS